MTRIYFLEESINGENGFKKMEEQDAFKQNIKGWGIDDPYRGQKKEREV
jgi:hypothetical protein